LRQLCQSEHERMDKEIKELREKINPTPEDKEEKAEEISE